MHTTATVGGVHGHSPPHWLRGVIVLTIILITITTAGAWSLGYRLNLQTASVPIPASTASPETVVRTYVRAFNHRDFNTLAALYPHEQRLYKAERHRVIGTMSDVKIIRSRYDTSYGRQSPYWAIDVELNYTGLRGADIAYQPGPNAWTYYLERSGPRHAWRIADHGAG
ncbi:hypothetical protein [Microlunatus soli]|nr:hypothetical protein [Microlunatus soli]